MNVVDQPGGKAALLPPAKPASGGGDAAENDDGELGRSGDGATGLDDRKQAGRTDEPGSAEEEERTGTRRGLGPAEEEERTGGNPASRSRTIAANGSVSDDATSPSGYSIIKADSLDAAVELARGCPVLQGGAAVQVVETFEAM